MKFLLSPLQALVTSLLLIWLVVSNPSFLQSVELKFLSNKVFRFIQQALLN